MQLNGEIFHPFWGIGNRHTAAAIIVTWMAGGRRIIPRKDFSVIGGVTGTYLLSCRVMRARSVTYRVVHGADHALSVSRDRDAYNIFSAVGFAR